MRLEKNLGTGDKIVRLTFSAVVIILFLFGFISGPLAAGLVVLSAFLLLTVIFSFCPVLRALGLGGENEKTKDEGL